MKPTLHQAHSHGAQRGHTEILTLPSDFKTDQICAKIKAGRDPHLPAQDGDLPLGDGVDALQPPLPLVDQARHVLHRLVSVAHAPVITKHTRTLIHDFGMNKSSVQFTRQVSSLLCILVQNISNRLCLNFSAVDG